MDHSNKEDLETNQNRQDTIGIGTIYMEIRELKLLNKVEKIRESNEILDERIKTLEKKISNRMGEIDKINRKRLWFEKRIILMKKSNSWKFAKPVRKLGKLLK